MILIDYSQTAISTIMAEMRGHPNAEVNTPLIRHMIINALRNYKKSFGAQYGQMVIACDSKKNWRKGVFSHYKANRKKAREDSGFDWNAIYDALNQIKVELAEHFPYPVIEIDFAEADDVIASLVFYTQWPWRQPRLEPVLILSGDQDFAQLQRFDNVKQYSTVLSKWVTPGDGVTPQAFLMEHILTGDRGDGVPNFLSDADVFVAGKRQKPIRKKDLEQWRLGSVDDWRGTEHEERVLRNNQLVNLDCVPEDIQRDVINSYELQKASKDNSNLLEYFMAYRMRNFIELVSEF